MIRSAEVRDIRCFRTLLEVELCPIPMRSAGDFGRPSAQRFLRLSESFCHRFASHRQWKVAERFSERSRIRSALKRNPVRGKVVVVTSGTLANNDSGQSETLCLLVSKPSRFARFSKGKVKRGRFTYAGGKEGRCQFSLDASWTGMPSPSA